ncbi:MAG: acylneuraminate cytidylyltransferase family protein [Pseudobutyrivibrio sp.]|nr:acylneuraminate cytidylyltransferase family protein [Pseudobutyrivibrio sp.]
MLAIIPARGGSKGLPGKNIRPLNGKPLIAYAVEAALKSEAIDRVIVTTDDEEIAEVAKAAGAEIPFMRPAELASDTASAVDVYIHAMDFMAELEGKRRDKFMVLLPTAPLRTSAHIDAAAALFEKEQGQTLISVSEAEVPPSWYMEMNEVGRIHNAGFAVKGNVVANRQVNDTFYVPNGAIFILDYDLLKEKRTYYSDNTVGFVMDRRDSVDIDYLEDFEYAEFLLSKKQ